METAKPYWGNTKEVLAERGAMVHWNKQREKSMT